MWAIYKKIKSISNITNNRRNAFRFLWDSKRTNKRHRTTKLYRFIKKTIENELIKNGLLNHNMKVEEKIDFAKIKLENKDCKKQLLLAHSMIRWLVD